MTEAERIAVPGYEGLYDIDVNGNIYALRRSAEIPMKQSKDRKGYLRVTLNKEGATRNIGAHRLVCIAFHGPPPEERYHAAHLNGNPSDNRLANLAWKTPKENSADRLLHGTHLRGETSPSAKLTEQSILSAAEALVAGKTLRAVARMHNVNEAVFRGIFAGNKWPHLAEHEIIVRAKAKLGEPRSHCKNGHPLTPDNVKITTKGSRQCRACSKAYQAERWLREKPWRQPRKVLERSNDTD